MSNIGDYQAKVAALSVEFTAQDSSAIALTATDAASLQNAVSASGLPVRLLLPWGGGQNISGELLEIGMADQATVRWVFSDYLLWRSVAFGKGIGDAAYDLREYASVYLTTALTLDPSSISDRMSIESIRVQIVENINFPEGSDSWYIGVISTWAVLEDDPPN